MPKKHKASQNVSSSHKMRPSTKRRREIRSKQWIGLGFTILAIIAVVLLAKPKSAQAYEITAAQAYQKYQQGVFILDVRTQQEWDEAHIKDSRLISLDVLKTKLNELPQDKEIVVVCRSGNRSRWAVRILMGAGFSNVWSLKGGVIAWGKAGYPLEKGNP